MSKCHQVKQSQPADLTMKNITVLIAEDHAILRAGLLMLLKREEDIEVIGQAENGREAVKLATQLQPDVIIMDIAMPHLNGIEATRQIIHALPDARIIILSAHADDAYVQAIMELGAYGYLIKQIAAKALPEAIRRVHQGKKCLSPTIAERRKQQRQRLHDVGDLRGTKVAPTLTSREVEVLQLIAEGRANKESAEELHISVKTVEKHRQSLMDKLNLHDTASLTRHAIATGIIESSVQSTIL
jgi:DNA-binding NarL/FixJ family response regulator